MEYNGRKVTEDFVAKIASKVVSRFIGMQDIIAVLQAAEEVWQKTESIGGGNRGMSQTPKTKLDLKNINHQIIVAGMTSCITDDGLTMHETLELLEDIKRQVAPALLQIQVEEREKREGEGA